MAGKKDERDQLAEASQKSGPLFPKHPAGSGSTITEKLLKKRSVPEEHRHNTKAPAEKKSKQKDAADANKDIIPATTSGEDQSRQDAIIRDPRRLTSCNATQQLPDPESSHAHASTHLPPSDEVESVSDPLDVDARTADYWRSIAMQLTRGSLHYTRSPEPTDNELFIYVTALRSCLSLAEQSINSQSIMIMGDYLMQRNVLARLKGREDYIAIVQDRDLAPNLAALERAVLQTVLRYFHKALEEGKITLQDIGRWKSGNPPQQNQTAGHERGEH